MPLMVPSAMLTRASESFIIAWQLHERRAVAKNKRESRFIVIT